MTSNQAGSNGLRPPGRGLPQKAILSFRSWAQDALFRMFPPVVVPDITVTVKETPQPVLAPAPEGTFLIGHASDNQEPIYALSTQLDRHVLIVGGTGCGKTTLIARLFTEEALKWQ